MRLETIDASLESLSFTECTDINGGGFWAVIGEGVGAFARWCADHNSRSADNGTWVN